MSQGNDTSKKNTSAKHAARQRTTAPLATRLYEALGITCVISALIYLLVLISYDPNDPGWTHIHSAPQHIKNIGGYFGAWLADLSFSILGLAAWLMPFLFALPAWIYCSKHLQSCDETGLQLTRCAGGCMMLIATSGIAELHFVQFGPFMPVSSGGILGYFITELMIGHFAFTLTTLILIGLLFIGTNLATGFSWLSVADALGKIMVHLLAYAGQILRSMTLYLYSMILYLCKSLQHNFRQHSFRKHASAHLADSSIAVSAVRKRPAIATRSSATLPSTEPSVTEGTVTEAASQIPTLIQRPSYNSDDAVQIDPLIQAGTPSERRSNHVFDVAVPSVPAMPSLDVLQQENRIHHASYSEEKLKMLARLLEQKLADFGIEAQVIAINPGPVITRFEIQPAPGIKVARITNLAKDLARSLTVPSVRIVEVIPGKPAIGIEIPNEHRETVLLGDVLATEAFQHAESRITLALGVNTEGQTVVADLAKMPHLLVAGTTGSGKSVGVNAMLLSLLYKATPQEVRLIMVDPKMLELSVYDGIPHLLTPVVTDMKEAANALRWCVVEMDRRYQLMSKLGVRNLTGFNEKIQAAMAAGETILDPVWQADKTRESAAGNSGFSPSPPALTPLPYIVVVIDEFAEMMMIVGKKVEELIARLAQKARAAGIHLILATQRPSVDVITGLIKANIPTRIAFQVSSKIDSRTILDQGGGEQLLGNGDMLYLPPGSGLPVRVHGAFVRDAEVHGVVAHWKQQSTPEYLHNILQTEEDAGANEDDARLNGYGRDPLYDQIVDFIASSRKSSISAVQRRFKIGYNRSARVIEQLEEDGILGPMETNGKREVLLPPVQEY